MVSCWIYACKFDGKGKYWRDKIGSYWYTDDIQSCEKSQDEKGEAKEGACGPHLLEEHS